MYVLFLSEHLNFMVFKFSDQTQNKPTVMEDSAAFVATIIAILFVP